LYFALCSCALLFSLSRSHIDFGFILSNSPGGNINFEAAPFKLTSEMIEVMGGEASEHYAYFQLLVIRGYLESRKHAHRFLLLLDILSQESRMACFAGLGIPGTLAALRERFKLDLSEEEAVEHAYAIIEQSSHNWRTDWYDFYQQSTNGIS
jgi:phosphatidylinositol kinase/protein kinase (PI-3  family)